MIDIHYHILPGIDDGAESIEESVEMARVSAGEGVNVIVATPHIYGLENSPDKIRELTDNLNVILDEASIPVTVLTGGEVVAALPPDVAGQYSINGTDYVLVEFPLSHMPVNASVMLKSMSMAGLKPVIAHPERNPSVIASPSVLNHLARETGSLVQITSSSLTGGFGRSVRLCSEYLLKKGVVDILASDAHSMRFRTPGIRDGMKAAVKIIGEKRAERLVVDNPLAVINGENICR